MSNTLWSWWRRGRDDHLDAAGVVAGRLLAALELSSEAAEAAVVRRRRSCPLCDRQRRRRPNLRSTAKTTAKARAWWRPCRDVVWYGRPGGAVRRRSENSGGTGGGAGRGEGVEALEAKGLLVSPTGGPGGTRACVQAVRARPFHPKPSASLDRGWVENGWNPDICPFEAVRWATLFVHFIPNGRGRTG